MSPATISATTATSAWASPDQPYRASMRVIASCYTIEPRESFRLSAQPTGDGWLIEDEPTGVHGHGATLLDALTDFSAAVREHVDVLGRQNHLSEGLADQLSYLEARLQQLP